MRQLGELGEHQAGEDDEVHACQHGGQALVIMGEASEARRPATPRTTTTTQRPAAPLSGVLCICSARLRQMEARLLGDILPRRWLADAKFTVIPDEQGVLAWDALAAGLPRVERILPGRSQDHPLIQLADLFAGLAAYSRDRYTTYDRWLSLPPDARARGELSAADRLRCRLLDDFFTACKYRRLGVSLRTNWGLRTYDMAAAPLGFWWAEAD